MKVEESFSPDLRAGSYYLTPERFAQLIGMSDRLAVVQRWIDLGEVPSRMIGGHLLVDLSALLRQTDSQ
ncbi:helix-turn-helix domain-containing protein [Pseudomonas sp. SCB32]|uniref:helix-turn-helix domain-containing protein n=1 Tax=Pseudomonas sp. SCB32 TaxID=2653853 RepID=UPI001263FE8B|nr:helix-turn-helix domain-containing protein [Pseudomonas sp. SCB32]